VSDKAEKALAEPCWTWLRAVATNGYGRLNWEGRYVAPHRLAWESRNGPVPPGRELHHRCANKLCYNPAHLELVFRSQHFWTAPYGPTWWGLEATRCRRGHPISDAIHGPKGRQCRRCTNDARNKRRALCRAVS
jgi:hypothetical protein